MDPQPLKWFPWKQLPGVAPFVGQARSKHAAVAVGDGLFIHGGDSGCMMLGDMLRFDAQDHSWSRFVLHLVPQILFPESFL